MKLSDLAPEIQALIRAGIAAKGLEASVQRCSRGEWECLLPDHDHDCVNHCIEIDHDQALAAYQAAIGGDE